MHINGRFHYKLPLQLPSVQVHWSSSPSAHFCSFAWGPADTPDSLRRSSSPWEHYGSCASVPGGTVPLEPAGMFPLEPGCISAWEPGDKIPWGPACSSVWGLDCKTPLELAGSFALGFLGSSP